MKSNVNPEYLLEVRKTLGRWIRQIRHQKKMSQRALAEKVGTSHRTIAKIERGEWSFGIDAISILAYHLDFYVMFQPRDPQSDLLQEIQAHWQQHPEVSASPDRP